MCYEAAIAHHLSRRRCSKLVFKTPAKIHIFLATIEGEVSAEFSRVPSGAQHRKRFLVLHLV
jgi:hypothetical protein